LQESFSFDFAKPLLDAFVALCLVDKGQKCFHGLILNEDRVAEHIVHGPIGALKIFFGALLAFLGRLLIRPPAETAGVSAFFVNAVRIGTFCVCFDKDNGIRF
jgi:hypothetical protein